MAWVAIAVGDVDHSTGFLAGDFCHESSKADPVLGYFLTLSDLIFAVG
jgi:hypothetical protein